MTPAELVARHKHILLDFDGPVCAVFGGELGDREAADELKTLVGPNLPDDVAASRDPFDVLRYANKLDDATAIAVETRFRELEIEAVATAPETPGTRETIKALIDAGHVVVIVSNNSTAAVRRYIDTRGWKGLVALISARNSANADLLKPSPSLLLRAVEALATRPATCIMIGDSEADVDAARASGIAAIGYANKPSKHDKLTHRGADAVVSRARELFAVAPADVERS